MNEVIKFLIGIFILLLGFPIGNFLARLTKEELKSGQIWFKLIILISILGGFVSLFLGNDVLLFSFLFIGIVTSRSLLKTPKKAL
jgi:hypothetical protein